MAKDVKMLGPGVVGEVEMRRLDSVKPNPWNPNRMTDFEKESLKTGLTSDGWLKSQALLIWGTDDDGEVKDQIIDGEHRWTAASELGFGLGPMVVLKGVSEAQAKALTVKMNAKRGKFQEDLLGQLLKDIQFDLNVGDLPLDVGIPPEEMMRFMAMAPETLENIPGFDSPSDPSNAAPENGDPSHDAIHAPPATAPQMQQGHVALLQLFYSKEDHAEVLAKVKKLALKYGTKNSSDTILAALREVDE